MNALILLFALAISMSVGFRFGIAAAYNPNSQPYRTIYAAGVAYQQCLDKGGTMVDGDGKCVKVELVEDKK